MTLVADTKRASHWKSKSHYSLTGDLGWNIAGIFFHPLDDVVINDVIVVYDFPAIETNLLSQELTNLATQLSEAAFSEMWDKEDDSYWDSYI